jgi:hypothetical protein
LHYRGNFNRLRVLSLGADAAQTSVDKTKRLVGRIPARQTTFTKAAKLHRVCHAFVSWSICVPILPFAVRANALPTGKYHSVLPTAPRVMRFSTGANLSICQFAICCPTALDSNQTLNELGELDADGLSAFVLCGAKSIGGAALASVFE